MVLVGERLIEKEKEATARALIQERSADSHVRAMIEAK
jgi:hypothetical protein